MSTISVNDTIAQGKAWLRARLDKGADCPLCHQRAQTYRRKLNTGQVRGLITMWHVYGRQWGHLPSTATLARLGGEFARLRYWGLVEEATDPRPDGGRAGWWRITDRGQRFVLGQLTVPTYAKIYNNKVQGFEGPHVNIKQALGTKFNYNDLMNGV